MRLGICMYLFCCFSHGLAATDLGEGFIIIDQDLQLELFRQKSDKYPERNLNLPKNPVMNLFTALDYEKKYSWFKPQGMSITFQKCIIKVINIENDWVEVETNCETNERMWTRNNGDLSIHSWVVILKKYCMLRSLTSMTIRLEPTEESPTTHTSTLNDFFNVVDVKGEWIRIVTNRVWEHLAPNGRIEDRWMKWKENETLLVKLYFDIDTGGNR
jgi:hypothetical protein